MKLGRRRNYHEGRLALRHYANQLCYAWLLCRLPNFMSIYRGVNACCLCHKSVLNVKAVVAAFNQEKVLVGAFSVITNLRMELFQALLYSNILRGRGNKLGCSGEWARAGALGATHLASVATAHIECIITANVPCTRYQIPSASQPCTLSSDMSPV